VSKKIKFLEVLWNPELTQKKCFRYFGKAGTAYAYQNVDIEQCRGELNRLKERIKTMKNNVNSKVMNMIENVEKKEASLKTMINTIEKDKRKIEETISTLDEYKREALVKTWEKVSA
jgi:structural maintenance of chromosome 2